ncbi:MAG: hypothetical protein CME65_06210 [Halobacteriovoraceae bacterium]|nr:hypothetical protein [Halobacteriovoraceae bacterium]|tara:strand:- start:2595 stop:3638 length:1044 start_codon:yes stop_codon:yes gene_type:complete
MRQIFTPVILLIALSVTTHLWAEEMHWEPSTQAEWNSANHPRIFFSKYESLFHKIPSSQTFSKLLWSDDYWPRFMGGISYRWQTYQGPRDYRLYSSRDIRRLSPQELDELSPAEKFDILNGDFDFPFTRRVIRQNPSHAPGWQGICHGWAEANLHEMPPEEKTLTAKGGIDIPFRRSDIAALLSYYYAKERRGRVTFLGRRCRGKTINSTSCEDVNPASFHIVLAESFKRSRGIIADIDPGSDVWNHPIKSYEYQVIGEREPHANAARGSVKEIHIFNKVKILTETSPSTDPNGEVLDEMYFDYWLELDSDNRVIGGSWHERPQIDFLWYRSKKSLPRDYARLISDK